MFKYTDLKLLIIEAFIGLYSHSKSTIFMLRNKIRCPKRGHIE